MPINGSYNFRVQELRRPKFRLNFCFVTLKIELIFAFMRPSLSLFTIMQNVMTWLPRNRPVHVLGIADPANIQKLTTLGCDTFDSCHATRIGRHGAMLTENGTLRVAAGDNKSAHRKPIENCSCPTCTTYSLSYLHHLVKAREPIAATLLSVHNIYFMVEMMKKLQQSILNNEI